jgi:hypothetical protein
MQPNNYPKINHHKEKYKLLLTIFILCFFMIEANCIKFGRK